MKVEFRHLAVHNLYGRAFNALSAHQFASGLNIVLAGNGTGKSVLTTAAGRVIAARSLQSGDCISGQLQIDGTSHEFHLLGPLRQQIDWPQALRPELYTWTLPEFLAQVGNGDCQQLAAAFAGGLNLDDFMRNTGMTRPPTALAEAWEKLRQRREQAQETAEQEKQIPHLQQELAQIKTAGDVLQRLQRWRQYRQDLQELRACETTLNLLLQHWPGLEKQGAKAWERVNDTLTMLEQAQHECQQAQATLQKFHDRPAQTLLQQADEETLKRLEPAYRQTFSASKERQTAIQTGEQHQQELIGRFRQNFSATPSEPLPQDGGNLTDRRLWRELDATISRLQNEVTGLKQDCAEAENKRRQAAIALPDIHSAAETCRQYLLRAHRLPIMMDKIREKKTRQEDIITEMNRHQTELLARTETEREAKEVAKILWQWQAQIQLSAQHPTLVLIAWALLGWMLVIAGTFVLPFAASFRASALVILGGLSTALILGVFIKNWQATQSRRHRQRLQQQFSAFCQPIEWNVDGVRSALETAMATMAAAQSQRDTLVRLQSRLEMLGEINEIAELDQFRQELARQTGLQLNDHDGYDLAGILANLNRLDEAEQRCQEMQSRLALTETQLQEARSDLLNSLRSQNIPAEISSWEVAEVWLSHIDALRHAYATQARISAEAKHVQEILLQQQAQLTAIYSQYGFAETDDPFAQLPTFRQWLQATENLRTANARCQSQENRLSVLLDACGIPTAHLDDTTQTLTNRLTELQNRRQPQQEWQNHHETIIRLHDKLNRIDIADFEPLRQHYNVHPDLPETELESLQQRLQQQTEREDTVREKLSRLEAEVAQATRGETMADLNCKLHDSINQTGQWLQTRTDNTATRLVCNFLQDKIKNEATPAIVREANLLIDQLSTGRYGDILVENHSAGQTLSLLDRSDGHRKTFAELSAGIRVHLGIAVRLACVQAAEENSGCQFPLFLDEIMAVSDTATARIIADALLNIALDRQIILLTCQEDDIHLLEEQAGRTLPKIRLAAFPMEYTPPQPTPQLSLPLLEIHHLDGAIPLRTALRLWPATLLEQILPELPPDCETVGVAVTRLTGPERSRAEQILDAAEVARQMLAPLTLTPDEIPADCSWCTDAFRQEVLEALQTARGNPFLFLELLAQIKKYGKRTETCREWLETNNRLNSPPTQLQVWQVVYNAMRGNDAERPLIAKKITELFLPETTLPLVARA